MKEGVNNTAFFAQEERFTEIWTGFQSWRLIYQAEQNGAGRSIPLRLKEQAAQYRQFCTSESSLWREWVRRRRHEFMLMMNLLSVIEAFEAWGGLHFRVLQNEEGWRSLRRDLIIPVGRQIYDSPAFLYIGSAKQGTVWLSKGRFNFANNSYLCNVCTDSKIWEDLISSLFVMFHI